MTMIKPLHRAFEALIQSGELGKTDVQNIYALLPELNNEGMIAKEQVIALLFAGSKNADGAYRNFLSRVQAAAVQAAEAAEEQGNRPLAAIFQSIKVNRIGKSSASPGAVQFSAEVPKELPQVTGRANRDYLPEEYLPGTGCKPEELLQLQQQELSRRQEQAEEKPPGCHLGSSRLADYCCDEFEPTIGNRHSVSTSGRRTLAEAAIEVLAAKNKADKEKKKDSCEALADLFDWLENSKTSLYALLGDYGMGKTFTCRVFAQQLAERCATNPSLPRPVYLDLRDVPTFVKVDGKTRQPTLEEMLHEVLRLAEKGADYSAEELIEAARKGRQLLIFDGLDEKLVYYTNDMRSQFLNELLRVFPQDGRAGVKIVISCRTHHFETISQMDSFLLGLNRSGVQGEDYRALHLLPFSSSQMLRLLTRLLGGEDANRVFSFIDSEAYLKDLAQRPFMLRQLSRTLPDLQQMKRQGLPINAAAFYQALIADSISRDDDKHILKPRHKQQLLTDLAAAFWQESTQVWQIDRLNDWFCAWLEARPALAAQYREEDWQVLEKDLRNSTLLVRFGEQDFGFSHSSMQEFFLSKWLLRQWQEDESFRMDRPVSGLTRQFVFDNLALLTEQELARFNQGLAATLARPACRGEKFFAPTALFPASDFALDIIAELAKQKRTLPELGEIDLRHGYFSNRQIRGLRGNTLLLDQAEAHASQWLDCHFQRIEVGRSDLSESLWRNCCWQKFDTSTAVFDFLQRVTMVNCQGSAALPELHILPSFQKSITPMNFSPANLMQVNYGKIHSCCFSPDGTRILSACDDDMLKLWNTDGSCIQTFYGYTICCFSPNGTRILASKFSNLILLDLSDNELKYFIGHEEKIDSCCFSPNGKIILSASEEDSLKLWDLDGRCIETFYTDYSEYEVNYIDDYAYRVTCCCFSPDGTRILLGAAGATSKSFGYTLRIWNLEGLCLQTFYGHEGWINSCCFNPDGTRILSAADDKTLKLWDLEGKCLVTMQGHSRAVNSCAFSPDGTCILSASDDGTLKLWDLSGCCLQTFQGHKSEVLICCFSPDGGRILSASDDGTMRLWNLDGTVERIFSSWKEQWYTAFFRNNQLEKIIGTEMSWKMANFAKDGKTWTLDETGCFEWVPAQY